MNNKLILFNNTYKSGSLSYLICKENNEFVGVCLELDLQVSAVSLNEAREKIEDLSREWVENIIENKLSEELLNKPAPAKYWKAYSKVLQQALLKVKTEIEKRNTSSPSQLYAFFCSAPYSSNRSFQFGFS